MSDLITVTTCSSRTEAEIAKELLSSNGVNSVISADDAGGIKPYPMSYSYGVELKVSKEDLEKAKKILTNQEEK